MIGLCLLLAAAPIVLTEANADQAIQVAVGQPIDIRLKCEPGCGYCWQTVRRKGLSLNGPSTFEPDPKFPGPGVGRPEIQVVRLVMDKAGSGAIVLLYGRPFDQKASDPRIAFRFKAKEGAK